MPRILVVEDESVVAMDIEDGLKRLGYEVADVVGSGAEAISVAERTRPDLIVMDIRLKGSVDGIDAAKQIHERVRTPVIFLSANVDDATLGRAKAASPFGYLSKPFNEQDLHRAIELALHKHRAEETYRQETAQTLRVTQEQFRLLVNSVRDFAIFLLNTDGIVVSWNAGAERIKHYSAAEILGRHFSIFYPPEAIAGAQPSTILQRAVREGEAAEEGWRIRKDGSRFWAAVLVTALLDADGHLTGFSKIVRDVSELKALQVQLEARALQQAGVARLSQLALGGRGVAELAGEAAALVVQCLGVHRSAVLELVRPEGAFLLRAAVGINDTIGRVVMPSTREWQAGYTLESRAPVVVPDYREEHRFSRSPVIRNHGIQSAATVAIRTDHEPYGVLAAYHNEPRAFTGDDVYFLQSLANIMATAIRHQQSEVAVRDSELRFRSQYQRLPVPTFAWQCSADSNDFVLVDYNDAGEKLTEGKLGTLVGKTASQIYPEGSPLVDGVRRAFEGGGDIHEILRNYRMRSTDVLKDLDMTFSFVPPDYVLLYTTDITERNRNEAQLIASREQLRSLSMRLISIQEEERKRIAREVHDQLGQSLTALKLNVASLNQSLPPQQKEAAEGHIERINDLIDRNIGEVRRISSSLRPSVLDDFGLTAAVQLAVDQFQGDSGIECDVSIRPEEVEPPAEIALVIYRILQEAMANVARHSQATSVEVRLRQDDRDLMLEIRDNGVGIAAEKIDNNQSLGLIGMRERAAIIGGDLRVEGVEGKGTIVSLHVPVESEGRAPA